MEKSGIIKKIIGKRDIYVEFQPIVSIKTRKIVGMEALSRGLIDQKIISPLSMFKFARESKETTNLDRLCREVTLEFFSDKSYKFDSPKSMMLFLNFRIDILKDKDPEMDLIMQTVVNSGIPTKNIVIEIDESGVRNNDKLLKFVEFYRQKGFLIALDDVGTGHSNLNRIADIKPDVVKIDMSISGGIDKSPYRREIFKSIVNVSKKIGAFTIAEGVETLDEVVTCMLCGVDFFQGFFFSPPLSIEKLYSLDINASLELAAEALGITMKKRNDKEREDKKQYYDIINELVDSLIYIDYSEYDDILQKFVLSHKTVECLYLVNIDGVQISDTVMKPEDEDKTQDPFFNPSAPSLYAPALKGDKHDIKNYFYAVKEGLEDPFISHTYISSATGRPCKTISTKLNSITGQDIVVCIDIIGTVG